MQGIKVMAWCGARERHRQVPAECMLQPDVFSQERYYLTVRQYAFVLSKCQMRANLEIFSMRQRMCEALPEATGERKQVKGQRPSGSETN